MKIFLAEGRLTEESAESLLAIQDRVYSISNDGELIDLNRGTVCKENGHILSLQEKPTKRTVDYNGIKGYVIDLQIDRIDGAYDRNWEGYNKRKWIKNCDKYTNFVKSSLVAQYGLEQTSDLLQLRSTDQKIKFLKGIGKTIWDSQFENYSRFIENKIVYKSGDETIDNIMKGRGGICSETVSYTHLRAH